MNTMGPVPNGIQSISYFWDCLTLSDECPFFHDIDPKLYYFGVGLIAFYGAFLFILLADLKFYWSLDKFQRQVDQSIELTRRKLQKVQSDQQRLQSTKQRTETQLKKGQDCIAFMAALRNIVLNEGPDSISKLTICTLETEDPEQFHSIDNTLV